MRGGAVLLAVAVSGCGADAPSVPTAPSSPPMAALPGCGQPASAALHVLGIPGASAPLSVSIDELAPAPGTTVRAGDLYRIAFRHWSPSGYVATIQVFVSDRSNGGTFITRSGGGCGAGSVQFGIPTTDQPLRMFVRLWVDPGPLVPGAAPTLPARAPDYEASEPVSWVVQR